MQGYNYIATPGLKDELMMVLDPPGFFFFFGGGGGGGGVFLWGFFLRQQYPTAERACCTLPVRV